MWCKLKNYYVNWTRQINLFHFHDVPVEGSEVGTNLIYMRRLEDFQV